MFCGSDRGGQHAAVMYSLINTARLNAIDPQPWLADDLGRLPEHAANKLDDLMLWNWRTQPAASVQTI